MAMVLESILWLLFGCHRLGGCLSLDLLVDCKISKGQQQLFGRVFLGFQRDKTPQSR